MPTSKHDLVQLCGLGSNTRPKFIYFEPMFLGLWLRGDFRMGLRAFGFVFLQDIWLRVLMGLWASCE
jgi:hypothetical protein